MFSCVKSNLTNITMNVERIKSFHLKHWTYLCAHRIYDNRHCRKWSYLNFFFFFFFFFFFLRKSRELTSAICGERKVSQTPHYNQCINKTNCSHSSPNKNLFLQEIFWPAHLICVTPCKQPSQSVRSENNSNFKTVFLYSRRWADPGNGACQQKGLVEYVNNNNQCSSVSVENPSHQLVLYWIFLVNTMERRFLLYPRGS